MIENNNQKEKRKVHARNYHQLQLEKVEKQKEAKRKALAKQVSKMQGGLLEQYNSIK